MSDNVDVFKKIIFKIPSTRKLLPAIIGLGFIYSTLFYISSQIFTPVQIGPIFVPLIAVLVFILPTITSGELLHRFLPDYPRKWGYFLSLSNQTILFVFSLILTGANNFANAWNVFWISLLSVYLSNLLVLLLTVGYDYVKRVAVLSFVQPLALLAFFHLSLGTLMQFSAGIYLKNIGFLGATAVALLGAMLIFEYLMWVNVSNISVLKLTSALLQKKQEALDLGYPTKPDVQNLEIENEKDSMSVSIPWIHPGPLEGFGGARITTDIIEALNEKGKGFFLHVPSTHKSDPTDPEDSRKILEAMEEPEKDDRASKMVKKDYSEGLTFYGRRIDGKNIVYMDASDFGHYDDYELSIFREIIDPEETIIVDLHNHEMTSDAAEREVAWYNTETAEKLRNDLLDFLDELEKLELHPYEAGFETDPEGVPRMALVEKVGDQETLLFGIEGNEAGEELLELDDEYSQRFDEALVFTTDTHRSIHELSNDRQVEPDRLKEVVEKAAKTVSPGKIGFTNSQAERMCLLQEDFSGLTFSINILVRLIPLTLILFYIGLIIWVW